MGGAIPAWRALGAALDNAIRTARSPLSPGVPEGRLPVGMRTDLADETGALLFSLAFADAARSSRGRSARAGRDLAQPRRARHRPPALFDPG